MIPESELNKIRSRLKEYLWQNGIPTDKAFRCLNPSHNDEHPSMYYRSDMERVYCYSCKARYDIFDLIGVQYGLPYFRERYKKACALLGITPYTDEKPLFGIPFFEGEYFKKGVTSPTDVEAKDYIGFYKACNVSRKETEEYLSQRGINPQLAAVYGLGYKPDFRYNNEEFQVLVIPITKNSYSVRNLDNTQEKNMRYRKFGAAGIWNADVIKKACNASLPIFITEGEIDALSIITAGGLAMALGSTAYTGLALPAVEQLAEGQKDKLVFIAACDNDIYGREANADLVAQFTEAGYVCYSLSFYEKYKDANEFLTKDREGFCKAVKRLQTKRGIALALAEENESLFAFSRATPMDVLYKKDEPIASGFSNIDNILEGGFRPGSFLVKGITFAEKTAFCGQIVDNIMEQAHYVLHFTWGLTKKEIFTKSAFRVNQNSALKEETPWNAENKERQIEHMQDMTNIDCCINDVEKSFYQRFRRYFVYDGLDMDVIFVKETVQGFITKTGVCPVVFVDGIDTVYYTKEAWHNVLRELRMLSRLLGIVVIVLCETQSNIGIQNTDVAFTVQREKIMTDGLYQVTFYVVRNRDKKSDTPIRLLYDPQHNLFQTEQEI